MFCMQQSVKKVVLTNLWDIKGPISIEILEKITTVNSTSYGQNSLNSLKNPLSIYMHTYILKTKNSDINTLHAETPLLHPSSYTHT